MPSLSQVKAANAATKLGYAPVSLFVGGTSGIGRASVEAFARYTNGDSHIIISGRNEAAAKEIIDSLPKSPKSTYEFLKCDATLMSNVSAACRSLNTAETPLKVPISKLNFLYMSPGFFNLDGRNETSEGIDKKLAVHFYARFKFAAELMPLLQAAHDAGEDARVVTVLGAGHGGKIDVDDLGLKKTYSFANSTITPPTYNSLMVEEFAARHPDISFTHLYPGFVDTPILASHWAVKWIGKLTSPFATSPADCAEFMIFPVFDPSFAKGAFHLSSHAEPVPASKLNLTSEAQKALYDHFQESVNKY